MSFLTFLKRQRLSKAIEPSREAAIGGTDEEEKKIYETLSDSESDQYQIHSHLQNQRNASD